MIFDLVAIYFVLAALSPDPVISGNCGSREN